MSKLPILILCLCSVFSAVPNSYAQIQKERNLSQLDILLEKVRTTNKQESEKNKNREKRFLEAREKQAELLAQAQKELKILKSENNSLTNLSDNNEKILAELEEKLRLRAGNLGEMHGVVKQASGDLLALVNDSLTSTHISGRKKFLDDLARSDKLPPIHSLQQLWFLLQQEMTESGKVVRFKTSVVDTNGRVSEAEVLRVGVFTASSGGTFLRYLPETKILATLLRQPASKFRRMAKNLQNTSNGYRETLIDPTRGAFLGLLIERPTLTERIEQGGLIGYIIILLGFLGLSIAALRLYILTKTTREVRKQLTNLATPLSQNPLGRVLSAYEQCKNHETESIESKLDEAILKELPQLERGQSPVKLIAAIAPLLGLLGTVVGMIATFQTITLFGSGDPKLMAGGISQALVTTMLGLFAAIPLLFCHSLLIAKSKALIAVLEQQSAGLIAKRIEDQETERKNTANLS